MGWARPGQGGAGLRARGRPGAESRRRSGAGSRLLLPECDSLKGRWRRWGPPRGVMLVSRPAPVCAAASCTAAGAWAAGGPTAGWGGRPPCDKGRRGRGEGGMSLTAPAGGVACGVPECPPPPSPSRHLRPVRTQQEPPLSFL